MPIKLSQTVGRNSPAEPYDVKQIKKALNRLGFYTPETDVGITGFTDSDFFDAIKRYQSAQGLEATGTIRPDDGIALSLSRDMDAKKEGQYIWRTVGDDKVRTEHAQYNGTLRDYADAPDPGEDYNCRCWADNIDVPIPIPEKKPQEEAEGLTQMLISIVDEGLKKWTWEDFLIHFYTGQGRTVYLAHIQYLADVIQYTEAEIYHKVEAQLADLIRKQGEDNLYYTTERSYDFGRISYPIGDAIVRSETNGTVKIDGNLYKIEAEIKYEFYDLFTDPLDLREKDGGSKPPNGFEASEILGTAYEIKDDWKTKLTGSIKMDE